MIYLYYSSACIAAALGLAAVLSNTKSLASWLFLAGMLGLASESLLGGLYVQCSPAQATAVGLSNALLFTQAWMPGLWLSFSLVFARGNYREFLLQWRLVLVVAFVLPLGIVLGVYADLVTIVVAGSAAGEPQVYGVLQGPGKLLTSILLIAAVIILFNFEKTFRAAVGVTRWRVKFLMVALCIVFGTKIYTLSQTLLFSVLNPAMGAIDAVALLLACGLMTVGYIRSGLHELDIYPSRTVLSQSLTLILVGAYLIATGVLAEVVKWGGGSYAFLVRVFTIILALAVLAIVVLSDRFKLSLTRFVSRHFRRPEYDFRAIWAQLTQRLAGVVETEQLCVVGAQLIAETFDTLSTNVVLFETQRNQLVLAASTSQVNKTDAMTELELIDSAAIAEALKQYNEPFDLDKITAEWAQPLRQMTPIQFPHGGHRFCVPLKSEERFVGVLVLADRVAGMVLTREELDLLQFIADELASRLMYQYFTESLVQTRELAAFQSISTFFVHDLKNAAASLHLTLQNLPKHFDDPEFRSDAVRGLAHTAEHIRTLIERLSDIRRNLELHLVESDLNQLVEEVLGEIIEMPHVVIEKKLATLPRIQVDRNQIKSVVTNLILNAQEAIAARGNGAGGRVAIKTEHTAAGVELVVSDDGCGMPLEFIQKSLFHPFQSTKKKGLGIGMFQARMIIKAHGGSIQVNSVPDRGTTFCIRLLLTNN